MTKTKKTTEESTQTQGTKRPTHIAYWVRERENAKGHWRPIGAAWPHADGKGFNVVLELQPLDGRMTLRVAEEK